MCEEILFRKEKYDAPNESNELTEVWELWRPRDTKHFMFMQHWVRTI
jgi:hypothetical protein